MFFRLGLDSEDHPPRRLPIESLCAFAKIERPLPLVEPVDLSFLPTPYLYLNHYLHLLHTVCLYNVTAFIYGFLAALPCRQGV